MPTKFKDASEITECVTVKQVTRSVKEEKIFTSADSMKRFARSLKNKSARFSLLGRQTTSQSFNDDVELITHYFLGNGNYRSYLW